VFAELLIEGVGVDGPVVPPWKSPEDAAIVIVSQAIKLAGFGYGEVPEDHGIDQGENCGVGTDSEGEGDHAECGEAGRLAQAAEGVAEIVQQSGHGSECRVERYEKQSLAVPVGRWRRSEGMEEGMAGWEGGEA